MIHICCPLMWYNATHCVHSVQSTCLFVSPSASISILSNSVGLYFISVLSNPIGVLFRLIQRKHVFHLGKYRQDKWTQTERVWMFPWQHVQFGTVLMGFWWVKGTLQLRFYSACSCIVQAIVMSFSQCNMLHQVHSLININVKLICWNLFIICL